MIHSDQVRHSLESAEEARQAFQHWKRDANETTPMNEAKRKALEKLKALLEVGQ